MTPTDFVKPVLPPDFEKLAIESLGDEVASGLFLAIGEGRELTSIRLNVSKIANPQDLDFKDNLSGPVKWCTNGFYLKVRPQFTLDPLFHAGGYYVQEASSMYMELVKQGIERDAACDTERFFGKSLKVLDLCAAPGGKSTHLASLLGEDSLLVANEVIKSRATILADNIAKWGVSHVMVTNNDPKDFASFGELFDLVVADVPCSGEGLFRKDSGAVKEWSLANVRLCSERQQRIVSDVWPVLKQGGYLVYSTCTYNHYENDDNLKFIVEELGGEVVKMEIPPDSGIISTSGGGLQFVPGLVEGEGQFVALIRKTEGGEICREAGRRSVKVIRKNGAVNQKYNGKHSGKNTEKSTGRQKNTNSLRNKICELGHLVLPAVQGEFVKGYPQVLAEEILFFETRLRTVLSGVAMGSVKGDDFIPHADMALSGMMQRVIGERMELDGLRVVEVNKGDALKFLAKEPLVFEGVPNGYLLLVYHGLGLGFVKNLGNRSNNLLPVARRIRMSIV